MNKRLCGMLWDLAAYVSTHEMEKAFKGYIDNASDDDEDFCYVNVTQNGSVLEGYILLSRDTSAMRAAVDEIYQSTEDTEFSWVRLVVSVEVATHETEEAEDGEKPAE